MNGWLTGVLGFQEVDFSSGYTKNTVLASAF